MKQEVEAKSLKDHIPLFILFLKDRKDRRKREREREGGDGGYSGSSCVYSRGFPNGVLYFSEYRVSLPNPRIFRENLHSFNSIKQQQHQLLLL